MKEHLKASIEQQKKCESEKLELKSIAVVAWGCCRLLQWIYSVK